MRERGIAAGTRPRVSPARHLLGLLRVTHPIPSALYVVMTAFLALAAARATGRSPDPVALALILIAVAGAQAAIGALNDYCDRAPVAAGQRDKPIVRGLIAPWEALALAICATVVAVAAILPLGPVALLLWIPIEGLGLLYDLRFKGTPLSAVLFALYFPLFPLLAWAVFGRYQPFLPWLLPFGALLGIAMNIANTLPDLEAARAAGVRGLPHLLGPRRGLIVAWASPLVVLAAMGALHLTGAGPARGAGLLLATLGALLTSGPAALLYRAAPTSTTLRRAFLIQAVGVLLLAGGWIAAVAF